jgi:protein O-mannosyl-transferase
MAKKKNNIKVNVEKNSEKRNTTKKVEFDWLEGKIPYLIIAVATIFSFITASSNELLYWDDNFYVTNNELVTKPTLENFVKLLNTEISLNYHPITMLSMWLNSAIFGPKAGPFIVVNVLIHIANTFLVFKLIKKLAPNALFVALGVALIWAVHPMRAESVIWIAERKDVLYTLFFLASINYYISYYNSNNKRWLTFSIILFVLSCLSKAMAVTLPMVLLLIDYWYSGKIIEKEKISAKVPYFIIALLFGIMAVKVQGGSDLGGFLQKTTTESAIGFQFSLFDRLRFGFYGFWVYIIKLFIPVSLHNYYAYPKIENGDFNNPKYILAAVSGILLLTSTIFIYKNKKEIVFGILFFFFTVVTVLQFLAVGSAILAERYSYIPHIGLLFALFYFLQNKIKNQKLLLAGTAAWALLLISMSIGQCKIYKNTETLFENSVLYEQHSPMVYEKLIDSYGRKGLYDKVISLSNIAEQNKSTSGPIYKALGNSYALKKDFTKAISYFDTGLKLEKENLKHEIYYNKALAYRDMGNFAEAAKNITIAHNTTDKPLKYIQLKCFMQLKAAQYDSCVACCTTLISNKISVDTAYNYRGYSKYYLGDTKGALQDMTNAVATNPNYIEAKNNLQNMRMVFRN